MPISAFGQALLDGLQDPPGSPARYFEMRPPNGQALHMRTQDFLACRREEVALLGELTKPFSASRQPAVLDVGCGAGRHLKVIREHAPHALCVGVERCPGLRDYCAATVGTPNGFFASLDALPEQAFDLILLVGNGLGIFGDAEPARAGVRQLLGRLRPSGKLVLETGHVRDSGYSVDEFTVCYQDQADAPYRWGRAGPGWIEALAADNGYHVMFRPSQAPGGGFFFAILSAGTD